MLWGAVKGWHLCNSEKSITGDSILNVPCLNNIFMVLLISALANIGATKPVFLDSGSHRRGGIRACVSMVCYHWIVHKLNSSKKSILFVSNSNLCRAILPNIPLGLDIFLCFVSNARLRGGT